MLVVVNHPVQSTPATECVESHWVVDITTVNRFVMKEIAYLVQPSLLVLAIVENKV